MRISINRHSPEAKEGAEKGLDSDEQPEGILRGRNPRRFIAFAAPFDDAQGRL